MKIFISQPDEAPDFAQGRKFETSINRPAFGIARVKGVLKFEFTVFEIHKSSSSYGELVVGAGVYIFHLD